MKIVNKIILNWSVEDPVYPYQNYIEHTAESFADIDWDLLKEQQEAEYSEWLAALKAREQGQ
jgi:hypothetical protein